MGNIVTAIVIMGGLGLFFGIALTMAYRFLKVIEDPRLEQVTQMLPGSNCGACGEPGCHGFAEKLLEGVHAPSRCSVANEETIESVAELLGVDAGEQEKRVARLHCAGGQAQAIQLADYEGYAGCRAAATVSGGGKSCAWGCLGLADCEVSCTFGAIHMNKDGLPVVDVELCTACGDCVTACPRNLFEILPAHHKLLVQCNIPLAGEDATTLCNVACDACGKCALDAAKGLVTMQNNLPVVNYAGGGPALPEATFRCPTGAIQWIEGRQFSERDPQ